MVNDIDTRYITPRPAVTAKKESAAEVESHTDERRAAGKFPSRMERRKRQDRRDRRGKNQRSVYDMRSGRGRRKTDRIPPSIDVDV